MAKRQKYTVGLWIEMLDSSKSPIGLQMWNIHKGTVEEPQSKWHTVILAENEEEALQLGQAEYASKNIEKSTEKAA